MTILTRPYIQTSNAHLLPIDMKDPSLVLYLPLWYPHGDMTGSTIYSYDLYHLSCTVSEATWGTKGRTFDGVDDYINVPHHASQLLTTGGTIEAWIKATTAGEGDIGFIVDKSTGYTGVVGYALILLKSVGLYYYKVQINNGVEVYSAATSIGVWQHIVSTWDATGLVTHYVDGSVSGTPTISADPVGITTTNVLRIGNPVSTTDFTFNGIIGEVLIYNRALSAGEIAHNYQSSKWLYK